jgi:hypothetical protein
MRVILICFTLLREPTNLSLYRLIKNFIFLVHINTSQIYNTLSCNIVFYAENQSANIICGFEANIKDMPK